MKSYLLIFVLVAALIITGITPALLPSQIIHVPSDYPTIQGAIDVAANGDTVLVAEGTYYENLQIVFKSVILGSYFLIDNDTSHISKTIINGSQPVNTDLASVITVSFSQDTTVICGLTITGGYGMKVALGNEFARAGGGMVASASNIMIRDNRIINNVINQAKVPDSYTAGASGGGIAINPLTAENLSIIIRNNLIADNYVESAMAAGGGIALVNFYVNNSNYINYIIENNIISNNIIQNTDEWKAMGGGIAMNFTLPTSGTQIIRNNLISGNKALCQSSFGGAMYIVLEERTSGGVVDNDPGPFIYNNIFEGNHSDRLGGAIAVWRVYWPEGDVRAWPLTSAGYYTPKPSFINNTFVNNTASDGSAFYIMNNKPFLMNNILWNDHPENAAWGEIFLGNEPTWTSWVEGNKYGGVEMYNSLVQDRRWSDIAKGIWNIDPDFSDTLYHLSAASPGIGTGQSSIELNGVAYYSPDDDFDGNTRPHSIDPYVDMGAYESSHMAQPRPSGMTFHGDGLYINPNQISPFITTEIINPHGENIKVYSHLQIPDSAEVLSTVELYDDGVHNDQQAGDHVYGGAFDPFTTEAMLNLFLSIDNISRGTTMVFNNSNKFTSIGPLVYKGYSIVTPGDGDINPGETHLIKFEIQNLGQTATAENITARIIVLDSRARVANPKILLNFGDVPAGQSDLSTNFSTIIFSDNFQNPIDTVCFKLEIVTDGMVFWIDSTAQMVVGIGPEQKVLPVLYSLKQNYPNPFNPLTTIGYQLPQTSQVDLSIYNILGQKVVTLVSKEQQAGNYQVEWDATGFASGVYVYRLSTSSGFIQTRKLVVVR